MKRILVTAALAMFCAAAFAEGQGNGNCEGQAGNSGRHGLVAHYYRDAANWDGSWPAGSKPQVDPADPVDRRELFVDDIMVDSMTRISLKMHEPIRREVSITFDKPWEGNGCGYTTVFQDGDKYRMYYHAWQIPGSDPQHPAHRLVIASAESPDGI